MTSHSRVKVHVDEHGAVKVEVDGKEQTDPEDLVAEKRPDQVPSFGDEEFKARQHIRLGGG